MRLRSLPRVAAALLGLVGVPAFAQERIGVGLDLFTEGSSMSGEQSINASRLDESFEYGAGGGAFSAWLLYQSKPSDRLRAGPGIRIFGNYGSAENPDFIFGFLTEAFMMGEYSLHAVEKFDAVFGGRAGLSALMPGGAFSREVDRLQAEGVDVWGVPRLGWLAGLSVGTRRKMSDKLWLRADLHGEYANQFLFSTHQTVDDLEFSKSWSTSSIRLGLLFGAELAL